MFGTIATTASAAAPHVGRAVVTGAKAVAAMSVAAKATKFAQREVDGLLDHLTLARFAAQEAKAEKPNKVAKTQERKAS